MDLSDKIIKAVMNQTGLDSHMSAYFINAIFDDGMALADIELEPDDTIVDLIVKGVMVYCEDQCVFAEETPAEKKARRERIVS